MKENVSKFLGWYICHRTFSSSIYSSMVGGYKMNSGSALRIGYVGIPAGGNIAFGLAPGRVN